MKEQVTKREYKRTKRARAYMESNPDTSPYELNRLFGVGLSTAYSLGARISRSRSYQQAKAKAKVPVQEVQEVQDPVTDACDGWPSLQQPEPAVQPVLDDVTQVLQERGSRYGTFTAHAAITRALKHEVYRRGGYDKLSSDQAEALDMIFHKIGRIINGDPDYADSWIDIAGYAKLVADRLQGVVR